MVPVAVVSKPKPILVPKMNKSTRLMITAAAIAGLYAGGLAVKATANESGKSAPAGEKAKESCKGKDGCKAADKKG